MTVPAPQSNSSASAIAIVRYAGSIMDISMKVEGSGSGKALDIGELLASAYSASAPPSGSIYIDIIPSQDSRSDSDDKSTDRKIMPGS